MQLGKKSKFKANTIHATAWDPKFQVVRKMLVLFQIPCHKQLEFKSSHAGLLAGRTPKFILICVLKGLQPSLVEECKSTIVQKSSNCFIFSLCYSPFLSPIQRCRAM
jgi:hypothetical protein